MYFRRKHILVLVVTLAVAFFLSFYKLDYYIYQPGDIRALDGVVKVENGSKSEGEMNLVTVRGGQATPIFYLMAKFVRISRYMIWKTSDRKESAKMNIWKHSCTSWRILKKQRQWLLFRQQMKI